MTTTMTRPFLHVTFTRHADGSCEARQYRHDARYYRPTARLAHLQETFKREMRRTLHEHITHPLFKALALHDVLDGKPKTHMSVRLDNGETAILERTTFFRHDNLSASAETFLFDIPSGGGTLAEQVTAIQNRLKDDLEEHLPVLLDTLRDEALAAQKEADAALAHYENILRLSENADDNAKGGHSS